MEIVFESNFKICPLAIILTFTCPNCGTAINRGDHLLVSHAPEENYYGVLTSRKQKICPCCGCDDLMVPKMLESREHAERVQAQLDLEELAEPEAFNPMTIAFREPSEYMLGPPIVLFLNQGVIYENPLGTYWSN